VPSQHSSRSTATRTLVRLHSNFPNERGACCTCRSPFHRQDLDQCCEGLTRAAAVY
jgi:hypothetical protein